ncbi:hypothetical protein GJAV_G00183950 [Gymnothorax javanicus]|nr:hypothetical protein GJAV_G00183950 [Gymnothorax javanicus]
MSLSQADVAIVEKAVQEALEQIEKNAPEEYAKLNADPEKKKTVSEAARNAATEQVKLAKEFSGQPDDIAERLAKHLPENRITMLIKALEFPTFRMDIIKKDDGKHWVELKRGQETLEPARALQSFTDIDWAKIKQYASILVEAASLVMSAAGISVSPGAGATEKAIDKATEAIQSSSRLQRAIEAFIEAWNSAGGSAYGKAKAIFSLIKESYGAKILWTIIKALCSNMTWYDWAKTAAKVTAMIIAALATDGAALIAEIALIVLNAVDFARKICNVNELEAFKSTM